MNATREGSDADNADMRHAAQDYLAALESGQQPDRVRFLAQFPHLAERLNPYLDALDLLHRTVAPAARPPAEESPPAEPLGDFRIVRRIGGGGMGTVYEAVQRSLGRRVALKVLPFAAALEATHLQRFQNEAQAAAQLHHPNIVPVYFVGCERGVHYYAMQLIEGQDLGSLIGQLRSQKPAAQDAPAEAAATTITSVAAELSTQRASRSDSFYRTAAGLIVQAAAGLEHAHQFGIIHRDIKPANLMVDLRGNVWITDFGLAQFHTGARLTRTGDVLGTLRYMSPEQAAGQGLPVDPRADVYSLGATLYELLTLQPMFTGDTDFQLLRHIVHDEPAMPRALDQAIPAELETIVLKAVSKVPGERYASAREFADDLRRFLENQPILARRAGIVQRAQKWTRRHPGVLAAGPILLVLLTIGSLLSAASIHAERQKTEKRAAEAEARFRLARRSVDEMIETSEELREGPPSQQTVRKRLLESALIYYQEFIDQRQGDPAAQEELRHTKARVERILADLAVLEGGARHFLLGEPSVQDDMQLSDQQRQQVQALRERGLQSLRGLPALATDERHQRFLALVRATEAELGQLLRADQLRRLQQIALQVQGPAAFREPSVAAQLQLTHAQREGIRLVEADLFLPGLHGMPPPGPPPAGQLPDLHKLHGQRLKQARERILALLTADQLRRWQDLTGAPFKGELSGPMPFGFPPPFPPSPPSDMRPPE